ncbi:MAG: transcriptional regulator [Chloroflexi bacterium B3_Chlor]|nr:MAG: transcriptional regulator [Chloroflexi bacterium B3_Chlor]
MSLARHWRLQNQRYRLLGVQCEDCGARLFPRRQVCPRCKSQNLQRYQFGGEGKVYSHTVVYDAPAGYEGFVPYIGALVELEEGPLIAAQLTDVDIDDVQIGMPVEMVTRRLRQYGEDGLIVYGYKFRPKLKEAP